MAEEAHTFNCSSCGAALEIGSYDDDFVRCPYCGSSYEVAKLLGKDGAARTERIPADTRPDAKPEPPAQKKRKHARTTASQASKNHGTGTAVARVLLICLAAFNALIALGSFMSSIPAGLIASAQVALFGAAAWRLRKGAKTAGGKTAAILACVGLALLVPWASTISDEDPSVHESQELSWESIVLADRLPPCGKTRGHVYSNTAKKLDLYVADLTDSEFSNYARECVEIGYTTEMELTDNALDGFDEKGYHLSLYHYNYSQEMSVELEAPKKMTKLVWPKGTIAKLIPEPKAEKAHIDGATETYLSIYVDGMSVDDVRTYEQQCVDAGFSDVSMMDERRMRAKDKDGNQLTIQYEGNNVMSIHLYES